MQLDIFTSDYPHSPGYRDTDTSKAAADDLKPKVKAKQEMVLEAIRRAGSFGATSYELARTLKMPYHTIQPRTSELKAAGKIADCGIRRVCPDTGKKGIAWVAA